jgi:hypothetical protein
MVMTFDEYVAAHVLKRVLSSELPAAVLKVLEEGHESTSLGALAGSSADNTSPSEIEEHWFRGLKEINQKLPSRQEAALILRNGWVSMVVSGSIPPMVGVRKMVHLATDPKANCRAESTLAIVSVSRGYWTWGVGSTYLTLLLSLLKALGWKSEIHGTFFRILTRLEDVPFFGERGTCSEPAREYLDALQSQRRATLVPAPSSVRGNYLRSEGCEKVTYVRSDAKLLTAGISVDTSRISCERQSCRGDFLAGRGS